MFKYWFKVITSSDIKHIKTVYNMMWNDLRAVSTKNGKEDQVYKIGHHLLNGYLNRQDSVTYGYFKVWETSMLSWL